MSENDELHLKYRPTKFKEVVGQQQSVKILVNMVKAKKVPHAIMFHGPSGCGKTTLARILASKLEIGPTAFKEMNCSDVRGIDAIRDIRSKLNLRGLGTKNRAYLIDEAHGLTSDAQDAFLKMLEEAPRHVYFMLATTHPEKLKTTIFNRCSKVPVSLLTPGEMKDLLVNRVLAGEGRMVSEEVLERIIETAEGSAREALVTLETVLNLEDEDEQLESIVKSETRTQSIELARILIKPKVKWQSVSKILKALDDDAEKVRRIVLGYSTSVLIGGSGLAPRAYIVINAMRDNFFDCGKAGLAAACFEIVNSR
jgi:DNA polymerase III gamma/tau subunit